jgi:2-dehydro-3-deoxygluconokinase
MKFDMTTFGETMIRISVRPGSKFINTAEADMHIGGAESNAAITLSRLGMKTAWVSRLTRNDLGRKIEGDISRHGVDTSGVVWTDEDRIGLYFMEFAVPPRAIAALYDRKNSAASKLTPEKIDWKFLLNTRMLHLTGITPALSPGCRRASIEAVKKAKAKKVPICFDVNYRAKLWGPKAAARTIAPLLPDCTLAMMNAEEAATVFGIKGEPEKVAVDVYERFRPKVAVITAGLKGAFAWDGKKLLHEPAYPNRGIIDRVGAGDAFAAGLIFGFLQGDLQMGLRYGIATSVMKLGLRGDVFWFTKEEVDEVIRTRGGDVNR